MIRFKRLSALGLAFAIGLTACDDASGPGDGIDDGPFNPTASAADLQAVQSAFDSPVFESLGQMSGGFARVQGAPALASVLLDAGWDLATAGESWQAQAAAKQLSGALFSSSAAVVLIPESFRGRTYEHHPEEGYYFNEERTGAPVNGMRFVLYEINPVTKEPGTTEIGYVDIMDESSDLSGVARLVVVSGDTEYMNYSVSATGLIGSITFGIAGFISNGVDQVDLDLSTAFSSTFATERVEIDYSIAVESRGFSMDASMIMEFNRETEGGSITLDIQFQERLNSVRIQGTFAAEEVEAGTLEVLVNGQLFATITIAGDSMTVAGADGAALSTDQAQALENMMDSFETVFDDKFEDFLRPVSWLFRFDD